MNVRFHGTALEHTGGKELIKLNNSGDIYSLIDEIGSLFGDSFRGVLLDGEAFFFLVNGTGIMKTGGFETKLSPEDTVEIVPFFDAG